MPASDREKLISELPLVASTLALPPIVDEALGRRQGYYKMTDAGVDSLHELVTSALNALALSEAEYANDEVTQGRAYGDHAGRLLGMAIQVRGTY